MWFWRVVISFLLFSWSLAGIMASRIIPGEWSEWSACSVTCGSGVQQRTFLCSVCQSRFPPKTRMCLLPCANHSMTSQGLFQRRGKNNMALKGHMIKEVLVSSEIQCALYCLRLSECQSFNIGKGDVQDDFIDPAKAHASMICQLNNAAADSEPEHFVHKNGFRYYGFVLMGF